MTTHYIQTLGVAKCREILSGAPEKAELFNIFYMRNVHSEGYIDHFAQWNGCKWQQAQAHCEVVNKSIVIADLRAELDLYDTDTCSDIANHISPLTVVIER